jgi:hypothetical protein
MSTRVKTECGGCREMLPPDEAAADTYGRMGLKVAIRYLPLETILRTIREHCAEQVGPGYTRREMEFDMLKDDLDATLVGTCWDRVDA